MHEFCVKGIGRERRMASYNLSDEVCQLKRNSSESLVKHHPDGSFTEDCAFCQNTIVTPSCATSLGRLQLWDDVWMAHFRDCPEFLLAIISGEIELCQD